MRDRTKVVSQPIVPHIGFASLATPTYRASTIVFDTAEDYAERRNRGPDGYTYGLHGTPTTRTLEAQISQLEGASRTVLLPSGQAAITLLFLSVLAPGDEVLIPDSVYPPVRYFCSQYLAPRGIGHRVYDPLVGAGIEELVTAQTKLIWMESPGSTTMEFQDIGAIARVARARGILTGCDNTWATPLLFKPLDHGVDFSMEAVTKYIGGHSDLLMGSLSVSDPVHYETLRNSMRLIGLGVSPDDCALALRGIQTLWVRLAHVGAVAADFAQRIDAMLGAGRVLHPLCAGCSGREVWERDFSGASGVFSVVLSRTQEGSLADALTAMKHFNIGASWGGTHSLVAPMTVSAERDLPRPSDEGTILRISIGLEDPADLWDDLEALFKAVGRA